MVYPLCLDEPVPDYGGSDTESTGDGHRRHEPDSSLLRGDGVGDDCLSDRKVECDDVLDEHADCEPLPGGGEGGDEEGDAVGEGHVGDELDTPLVVGDVTPQGVEYHGGEVAQGHDLPHGLVAAAEAEEGLDDVDGGPPDALADGHHEDVPPHEAVPLSQWQTPEIPFQEELGP